MDKTELDCAIELSAVHSALKSVVNTLDPYTEIARYGEQLRDMYNEALDLSEEIAVNVNSISEELEVDHNEN